MSGPHTLLWQALHLSVNHQLNCLLLASVGSDVESSAQHLLVSLLAQEMCSNRGFDVCGRGLCL